MIIVVAVVVPVVVLSVIVAVAAAVIVVATVRGIQRGSLYGPLLDDDRSSGLSCKHHCTKYRFHNIINIS